MKRDVANNAIPFKKHPDTWLFRNLHDIGPLKVEYQHITIVWPY